MELDRLSEVPVTVIVYVCGALLEPPQPLTPAAATKPKPAISNTEMVRLNRLPALRNLPAKGSRSKASENSVSLRPSGPAGSAAAEVCGNWIVSVSLVVPAPAAMLVGEKTAVAPIGNPLAAKVTANGKAVAPFDGVKVKVNTAALPGVAVTVELVAVKVKSGVVEDATVTVTALEVEAASFVVAPKPAVIESAPTGKVVKLSVARPEVFTVPVPMEVLPL